MNKKKIKPINGTWGELWLEGELLAETYKFQAKETYTREKIAMCGSLVDASKLTKVERTGSVGIYKVNSMIQERISAEIKAGRDPEFTLISKLADPDVNGVERIAVTGVKFDDLTLADWEASVTGKAELPFTFTDYEYLDTID